jgi:hypothetical protein
MDGDYKTIGIGNKSFKLKKPWVNFQVLSWKKTGYSQ